MTHRARLRDFVLYPCAVWLCSLAVQGSTTLASSSLDGLPYPADFIILFAAPALAGMMAGALVVFSCKLLNCGSPLAAARVWTAIFGALAAAMFLAAPPQGAWQVATFLEFPLTPAVSALFTVQLAGGKSG